MEDGVEIGYSITFAKGGTINLYHGSNGATPTIGVKMDEDGSYYWTYGDQWITDDNGNSWRVIQVEDEECEEFFQNITYDNKCVYITLADGTLLTIVRADVNNTIEGEDLTHLFDFNAYPAESYSVDTQKYTTSIVFDSAMADLSEYAGRTIEITIPQYSNMHGKAVGYAVTMVDAEKNFIRSLKRWEAYTLHTLTCPTSTSDTRNRA